MLVAGRETPWRERLVLKAARDGKHVAAFGRSPCPVACHHPGAWGPGRFVAGGDGGIWWLARLPRGEPARGPHPGRPTPQRESREHVPHDGRRGAWVSVGPRSRLPCLL